MIVLAVGAFFIWFFESFYMQNLHDNLQHKTRITSELVKELLDRDAPESEIDVLCKKLGNELGIRFTVIDPGGVVLGDSLETPFLMDNHALRPEIQDALKNKSGSSVRYSSTVDKEMFYIALPVYSESYGTDKTDEDIIALVRTAVPFSEIKSAILRIQLFILIALVVSGVGAVFIGLILSRRITGPVFKVNKAAKEITAGNFNPGLIIEGDDELASLAGTVNEMGRSLQKQLEEILLEKNKIETVISFINSGIVMFNSELYIDILNPAAEKMFDLNPEKVKEIPARSLFRYHLLIDNLEKVKSEGKQSIFELNIFYPANTTVEVTLLPVKDDSGYVKGILAVFHDITSLRSLEKMRSEFVANVSHELRTPMTAIRGYTETLLEIDLEDKEKAMDFLQIIARETLRLNSLIDSLLDLSVIEESKGIMKKQLTDLKDIINESITIVNESALARSVSIKKDFPGEKVIIQGNPEWLKQAMVNILDNAINYGFQGGRITVGINLKNEKAEVFVEDNGPGIPAPDIPHLFERFYRVDKARSRKLGGKGLGLSIVKHILDAHDASCEIESTVGAGTIFKFSLPNGNE